MSLSTLASRHRGAVGLGLVLLAGAAVRAWLLKTWSPAFLGYPDEGSYIIQAHAYGQGLLFSNPYRPAGYPLFLVVLHAIRTGLRFLVEVQHLLGLLTAALLYVSVARVVRHRVTALLPAAVVAFSATQIFLEHSVLSETLYTLLVVGGLTCAARSVQATRVVEVLWLTAAGALIGLSAPVRSVGVFVAPVVIVWAAASRPGGARRLRAGVVVLIGVAIPLGWYLVAQHAITRTWGLTRTSGETLYARTAIFADCRDFTPPVETAPLCPPRRGSPQGATYYMFAPASPSLRAFGAPPDPGLSAWPPDAKLGTFARAAILHQPGEYLWTTLQGLVKYVDPSLGTSAMIEWAQPTLLAQLKGSSFTPGVIGAVAAYYPGAPYHAGDLTALDEYASLARVEGPVTAILLVLMLIGMASRARARPVAWLYGTATLMMMVAPVALLFYGARYATPAYGPLAAGAAIGLDAAVARIAGRRPDGVSAGGYLPH